jgi:hypothetical protein
MSLSTRLAKLERRGRDRSWRRPSSIHCATKASPTPRPRPACRSSSCRRPGHFHSSFTMVNVIPTAASGREKMAQALQRFAGLEEPGVLPKAAE